MNNRGKLNAALQTVSPALKAELNYYMNDVEHESPFDEDGNRDYDLADALEDVENLVDQKDVSAQDKKILKEIHEIYVNIGFVEAVDITKIFSTHPGKKYWFKYKGQHMQCVDNWESWIKK